MSKIWIELFLLWTLISCRNVKSELMEKLPASRSQVRSLAESVCNELFDYNQISRKNCKKKFWEPDASFSPLSSSLRIKCRYQTKIKFEVDRMDLWQLAVLIPEKFAESDHVNDIKYSLIKPNDTFREITSLDNNKSYIIFSSVIDEAGRLSMWKMEDKLPPLINELRDYSINVQFLPFNDSKLDRVVGVFTWNQTGDLDVCFDFVNYCPKSGSTTTEIWPNSLPIMRVEEMQLNDDCIMLVKGLHGTTKMKYQTPSASSIRKRSSSITSTTTTTTSSFYVDDIPEIPQNVSIMALEKGEAWSVTVSWSKPYSTPDSYNVTLRANRIETLTLNGKATKVTFNNVMGEGIYNVSIYAKKGTFISHTIRRAVFPVRSELRWESLVVGTWCGVGLAIAAATMCWLHLRKRMYTIHKPKQHIEVKSLEESGPESAAEESRCEDGWEVKFERVALHEIIGEGAFGVVRRGTLAPTGMEVAVKMLKDFPTLEEIRAFHLESELMKSVGAHPHVVSLIGCCSGQRPLIIAEYCSRGDLLSFLRCAWDMMVTRRNMNYNNNEYEYRNDLFRFQAQHLVVNKLYDLEGIFEPELTLRDLLSFCRQIAMGMEFLASNRLVHRDLAARNILVTDDRTLKIADFGLSRDVYEENQYKQKGNGKMPVKWMALESLTRRIYTTQSDVWSFGVVIWEVVTLGGSPYAAVPAERLTRMLRAGYRMPRPANCTKQLYDVMLSCWRAQPRARPTFAALHRRLDELLNSACADDYLCLELDEDAPAPPPPAPPTPKHQRYFNMLFRAKRAWSRGASAGGAGGAGGTYERPLKAPLTPLSNHYTSTPTNPGSV